MKVDNKNIIDFVEKNIGKEIKIHGNYMWHDNLIDGCWHEVKDGDKFIIESHTMCKNDEHVRIRSVAEHYNVFMHKDTFMKAFLFNELRKKKLSKLNNIIE